MPAFRFQLRSRPLLTIEDYRREACRRLPDAVWGYVDGGAEDEVTLGQNLAGFGRWALQQRVLAGHGAPKLATSIAGQSLALPLLLAPTGLTGLCHPDGEIAAARGAETAGTRLIVSNAGSRGIEEVARATSASPWFQLYPFGDREVMASMMRRVERAGVTTLAVTLDVAVHGRREREQRLGSGPPPVLTPARLLGVLRRPRWLRGYLGHDPLTMPNFLAEGEQPGKGIPKLFLRPDVMRTDLNWDDLRWMREQWRGPLVAKGILHPDDARMAVDAGVDAIIVSNHGGRQLDGALDTMAALPAVVAAVERRAQVLLDGGIRRGSDIVKALCLGADACLIGRPVLYGLAVSGQTGAEAVLAILKADMLRTMTLMGVGSVADLDRRHVTPAAPHMAS